MIWSYLQFVPHPFLTVKFLWKPKTIIHHTPLCKLSFMNMHMNHYSPPQETIIHPKSFHENEEMIFFIVDVFLIEKFISFESRVLI